MAAGVEVGGPELPRLLQLKETRARLLSELGKVNSEITQLEATGAPTGQGSDETCGSVRRVWDQFIAAMAGGDVVQWADEALTDDVTFADHIAGKIQRGSPNAPTMTAGRTEFLQYYNKVLSKAWGPDSQMTLRPESFTRGPDLRTVSALFEVHIARKGGVGDLRWRQRWDHILDAEGRIVWFNVREQPRSPCSEPLVPVPKVPPPPGTQPPRLPSPPVPVATPGVQPPAPSPALGVLRAGTGSPHPSGSSTPPGSTPPPTAEGSPSSVGDPLRRPCHHNSWDNVRARKGWQVLRCRECASQWRLRTESVSRCTDFGKIRGGANVDGWWLSQGCNKGGMCDHLHIHYTRQQREGVLRQRTADTEPPSLAPGTGRTPADSESADAEPRADQRC